MVLFQEGQRLKVRARQSGAWEHGGPQAITDARSVLQAAGDSVDLPLLRRLAARYGRQARESLESILTAPDS